MLWLLSLSDSEPNLFDIALRLPFGVIRDVADALMHADLLPQLGSRLSPPIT